MSGPLRRRRRHRPHPCARRAALRDDARRHRRPGHQGREPRARRRLAAAGGRRSSGPTTTRVSTYFLSCNRNKESVTLDLKSDDGTRRADPAGPPRRRARGELPARGARPARLRRRAAARAQPPAGVLSITGFGHDGPEGGRAGYDQIAQGEGGLMSLTGTDAEHPQRVGVPIGDLLAGMYGAYGVRRGAARAQPHRAGPGGAHLAARVDRRGARVPGHPLHRGRRGRPRGQGNHHPSICPYGLFTCADGMIQLSCGSEGAVAEACAEVRARPVAPGFATNRERVRQPGRGDRDAQRGVRRHPHAELMARLAEIGIPAGEVRTLDRVYDWDQTRVAGPASSTSTTRLLGRIEIPGRRSGSTTTLRRRAQRAPPPAAARRAQRERAGLARRSTSALRRPPTDADGSCTQLPTGTVALGRS